MQYITYLISSLSLASAAAIDRRAGGPAVVPIPADCPTDSPTSQLPASSTGGWKVKDSVVAADRGYYYMGTVNTTTCASQCYGIGPSGSCVAIFAAKDAVTPAGYYGTPGGTLQDGCFFFDRHLTPDDFEEAPAGQYQEPQSLNIGCVKGQ